MPEVVDPKAIAKNNLLVIEEEMEQLRAILKLLREKGGAKGSKYNLVPPFAGKSIQVPTNEPHHVQTGKLRSEQ